MWVRKSHMHYRVKIIFKDEFVCDFVSDFDTYFNNTYMHLNLDILGMKNIKYKWSFGVFVIYCVYLNSLQFSELMQLEDNARTFDSLYCYIATKYESCIPK